MSKKSETGLTVVGTESGVHEFDDPQKTKMQVVPMSEVDNFIKKRIDAFCESRLGFEEDIKTRLGVAVDQGVEVAANNRAMRKHLLFSQVATLILFLVTVGLFAFTVMRTDGRHTAQDAAAETAEIKLWTAEKIRQEIKQEREGIKNDRNFTHDR